MVSEKPSASKISCHGCGIALNVSCSPHELVCQWSSFYVSLFSRFVFKVDSHAQVSAPKTRAEKTLQIVPWLCINPGKH